MLETQFLSQEETIREELVKLYIMKNIREVSQLSMLRMLMDIILPLEKPIALLLEKENKYLVIFLYISLGFLYHLKMDFGSMHWKKRN